MTKKTEHQYDYKENLDKMACINTEDVLLREIQTMEIGLGSMQLQLEALRSFMQKKGFPLKTERDKEVQEKNEALTNSGDVG